MKENTQEIFAEKVNSAVLVAYELQKDKIQKIHDVLLMDAEKKLAELRRLSPETKIRYKTYSGENFEGVAYPATWDVVTRDEFIDVVEKEKIKISIKQYLKFVTEGLAGTLAEEVDYLEKHREHLIRDQFSYEDHYLLGKYLDSGSIVPEYTVEGNGLSKLENNPFSDSEKDKPIIDI